MFKLVSYGRRFSDHAKVDYNKQLVAGRVLAVMTEVEFDQGKPCEFIER